MSSEALFWKEIRDNVGHAGHWDRIESHSTSNGFPDTSFTIKGIEGKVELKYGIDSEVRPSQVRWFRKNATNKGNCWLFTKLEIDGKMLYMLFLGKVIGNIKTQEESSFKDVKFWKMRANNTWEDKPDWDEFINVITKNT